MSKIKAIPTVGETSYEHPDYTNPMSLVEILNDLLVRVERLEGAYVSIDAEIKYPETECCEDETCFMCK